MNYIKIKGKDFNDCLLQMKMKYGSEAHVLGHKEIQEGGLLGSKIFGKKFYELEVGIPEKQSSKEKVEKKIQDLKELLKSNSNAVAQREPSEKIPKPVPRDPLFRSNSFPERKLSAEDFLSMRDEFIQKKPEHIAVTRWKNDLLSQGMTIEYVDMLLESTELRLSPLDWNKKSAFQDALLEEIESRIQVNADLLSDTKRGRRKIIILVGPTGSGKTTTIAKLAAQFSLHKNKKTSLYTTDNYRIAAVEQLKKYADTMDIPFVAVRDHRKLKESLIKDGAEVILVDTAGYSHKNQENLLKAKEFLPEFSEKDDVEYVLVLPTTASYQNAKAVLEAYELFGIKKIILTKTDETESLGIFVELADNHNKEFSQISVGQDVPFDILAAEKKLLSNCVLFPETIKGLNGEIFTVTK
jgi:flagellar biosynthesis protein FlhF